MNVRQSAACSLCLIVHLSTALVGAAEPGRVSFETRVLDPQVGQVCYAVTSADVDGDGKPDVVAVTENRVVWFQNPSWKPRTIIENQTERDNVCIAPHDIDGDGQIDFALGAGWTKIGTLQWLARGKTLDEKWKVHAIGVEGWLHRVRWGDILGTGKSQLIISPLNKTVAPRGVRLLAFSIPDQPATGGWKATELDASLNAMHNHWTGDFDGDGRIDVLTASMEGVFLFQSEGAGKFKRVQLGLGEPGTPPAPMLTPQVTGAGEIKVGRLNGRKFIATVEPMHGHSLVIYTQPASEDPGKGDALWQRTVLDNTLKRGHALGVADFDGDGQDEIALGHSDPGTGDPAGPGVFLFQLGTDQKWHKHVVDNGGIATEDLVVDDFNGDGVPDIAAGGRSTHNVKLYLTQRAAPGATK